LLLLLKETCITIKDDYIRKIPKILNVLPKNCILFSARWLGFVAAKLPSSFIRDNVLYFSS